MSTGSARRVLRRRLASSRPTASASIGPVALDPLVNEHATPQIAITDETRPRTTECIAQGVVASSFARLVPLPAWHVKHEQRSEVSLSAHGQPGGPEIPVRPAELRVHRLGRAIERPADLFLRVVQNEEPDVARPRAAHAAATGIAVDRPES